LHFSEKIEKKSLWKKFGFSHNPLENFLEQGSKPKNIVIIDAENL
jgi:hypothetical protein